MFFKLFIIILSVGALACTLLVIRQQRIEAAHEMSLIHHRLSESERTLWQLRSQIAGACRPEQVRSMVDHLGGEWTAIPAPRAQPRPAASEPRRIAGFVDDRAPAATSGG